MREHDLTEMRTIRSDRGASRLDWSRVSLSEVQVCGIPKLSDLGVAPT